MNLEILTSPEILNKLIQRPFHPWELNYLAHYSSYWDGISTDPRILLIPVDDHLVHRGDGVFEAFRLINNSFYLLEQHLTRLRHSAEAIGLYVPWSDSELKQLIEKLAITAGESHLIFRLFVSRGCGGFTTNPYESPAPQLTLIACRFKPMDQEKYQNGALIGRSKYLQKPEPYATIKSCNYLPNVLMKKEAIDRKLDFVVAFNNQSYLTESSTENIFILNHQNELLHPHFGSILKGTTLVRCLELAKLKLNIQNRESNITEQDLLEAKEVFMAGTTLDILPVSQYETKTYEVGPIGQTLNQLIQQDQSSN